MREERGQNGFGKVIQLRAQTRRQKSAKGNVERGGRGKGGGEEKGGERGRMIGTEGVSLGGHYGPEWKKTQNK